MMVFNSAIGESGEYRSRCECDLNSPCDIPECVTAREAEASYQGAIYEAQRADMAFYRKNLPSSAYDIYGRTE